VCDLQGYYRELDIVVDVCMRVCIFMCVHVYVYKCAHVCIRVVQFGFLGARFETVCESSRTLKLFEQFDVQSRKWRTLLVSVVILVQNMLVLYICNIVNQYTKIRTPRPSKALSCILDSNFGQHS
jgi:hypothetical protein